MQVATTNPLAKDRWVSIKRMLVWIAVASAASPVLASDWEVMGKLQLTKEPFEYKTGSIDIEGGEDDANATALIRFTEQGGSLKFFKGKVSHAGCRAGYGTVRFYSLDNTFRFSGDFVDGGGSFGTSVARHICDQAWSRAISKVLDIAGSSIDYADGASAKAYDAILVQVNGEPATKGKSIDWVSNETHRRLVLKRSTAAQ